MMRRGAKAGSQTTVVYLAITGDAPGMAGFAVSRAVGGAVVRNRVKRRLRAILAERIGALPTGSKVVVRALPAASEASFLELRADVMSGLDRCLTKAVAQ